MIETAQSVLVRAAIDDVWRYARDVERWAEIMPGYQQCALIDEDNSRWVLKVGVGGLVRTVTVLVHVNRWAGPEEVDFTYRLEGDPVDGGGCYRAALRGVGETEITLRVHVNGSGQMAPMWEAMAGPLLPKFALGFAEQLKARIEGAMGVAPAQARRSMWARLLAWLLKLFGRAK